MTFTGGREMTVSILDCTLRDGGHQNDWHFEVGFVHRYLDAIALTGVRYVELGYRTPSADAAGEGAFRRCDESLLRELCDPGHFGGGAGGLGLAVMIETKHVRAPTPAAARRNVRALLSPRVESAVSLVRIATSLAQVQESARLADAVGELGYEVSVNLMRASGIPCESVRAAAAALHSSAAGTMYLADSFGALLPHDVRALVVAARSAFGGRVGFHAHDNLGLALANSLAAIEAGASLVDGFVHGMGRGGGNARTELLLAALSRGGEARFSPAPLFELVDEDLARMHERFGWGPTSPFVRTGMRNVHPDEAEVPACR